MKNSLCVLPFYHLDISPNGGISPCCDFDKNEVPNDIKVTTPDVFNNDFFKKIRIQSATNQKIKGCEKCYNIEDTANNSVRIEMLERYKLQTGLDFVPPETPTLVYLNVALSNLCNSKCRMCNSRYSTSWYNDSKVLGLPIPSGVVTQTNSLDDYNLSNLISLNLVGGEPLMEQDKIISLLKKCNLNQLKLVITTNATLRPNKELMTLLKQCHSVEWTLSIDAYGPLNDFLRKGSQWEEVNSNLEWFYKTFPIIYVNSVISIYNANCFDILIRHIQQNFPKIKQRHLMVTGVEWMQVYQLPTLVKEKLQNKIKDIKKTYSLSICDLILDVINKPGNFEIFKTMDTQLNNIRQEHWRDFNIELHQWIAEY